MLSDIKVHLRRCGSYLLLGSALLLSSAVNAAIFLVDSTVDLADLVAGDGLCEWGTAVPVGQRCSLRAAVVEANALAGEDVIIVPEGMTFVLARLGRGEDAALSGDLDITESVIIGSLVTGAARPVINANGIDRVFDLPLNDPSVNARFANLVIRGGAATQADGFSGGGIHAFVMGNLEIWNTELTGNSANAGGGLDATANNIDLFEDTIRGNIVSNLGITNVNASGLHVRTSQSLTISRTTVSGNLAFSPTPFGFGAWIEDSTGTVRISNSTFSNNLPDNVRFTNTDYELNNVTISGAGVTTSQIGISAFWALGGISVIDNSIIDGHSDSDCDFSVGSGVFSFSHNFSLFSDESCGLGFPNGNIIGVSAQLGPLANNGGKTLTHFPADTSPVLDNGNPSITGSAVCEPDDQRGYSRPQAIGMNFPECDMGAVEANNLLFMDGFEAPVGLR